MYKQGSSKEITLLRDEGARLKSEIEELKKENEQLKAQIKAQIKTPNSRALKTSFW